MKKINFNRNWDFTFDNNIDEFSDFAMSKYGDATGGGAWLMSYNNWQKVDLPHDWAVALPKDLRANTFAGARANTHYHRYMTERQSTAEKIYNVGWYRKQFTLPAEWIGKRVFIEFEGVFRDSVIFCNGVYLDRHNSGYTGFILELTDHLREDNDNSIAVRVDSDQAEGWWYEGSGIYRNVNILLGEPTYFKYNQTVVKTSIDGCVDVSAVLVNDRGEGFSSVVTGEIVDREGGVVATASANVSAEAYGEAKAFLSFKVEDPSLWSVDNPYLYTLRLSCGEECETVRFGIRTVAFDADRGFLLNGKEVKVRGACVHQDFGGVGVALSDNLNYYKIKRLKDMGVNAYRSAHHAPTPALLDACDELGMLVMDETRMFGTSEEAQRQLVSLLERDRNHPCVMIWSLGNEEFSIQNKPISRRLMEKISRIAKTYDDRPVTYGGNNGKNFDGANASAEIRGVNYIMNGKDEGGRWLDIYHAEHPDQSIIGTEESSYVLSRGGAKNNLGCGLLNSYGDVTMSWGSTLKGWVKYTEKRPYFSGSFMWTGFDYRGEPSPFSITNVSSSFGTIDLCGMEKPPFYYYKAWWTDEPVLKLAPHWNHAEGEEVTLAVFTNCEEVTLSVNGKEIATKKIEKYDAPQFTLTFEAGVVEVVGKRNGEILKDALYTSGKTAELRVIEELSARGGDDIAIYEIDAYDDKGIFCPMAAEKVSLTVENGEIVGVGNGDPADLDYEQKPASEEAIRITTFSYEKGLYSVPIKVGNTHRSRYDWLERRATGVGYEDDYRLVTAFKDNLAEPVTYNMITTVSGVAGYEYIEFERLGGDATVYLNGELIGDNVSKNGRMSSAHIRPYRFYCNFREGDNEIKVVTVQQESSTAPISGVVKVGRAIKGEPWEVRLHYGRARVFVKSETPEAVKLNVRKK